jgi:CubicO group peptidase (beta-lactamase class C family)
VGQPEVPDRVSTIDDYVAHLGRQGFSGALLVARDGDVTAQALGWADRPTGVANTVDTAFDIGSIAKTLTAAAVLARVDDGRLRLDDTLGELFDDVPADKRDVTVRQLLDFTSGLREYHDAEGDFEAMTRDEARERILAQELLFEPGTDTAYSNSSYTLAALIVEQVTGRAFVAVVGDLFTRAGLDRTGYPRHAVAALGRRHPATATLPGRRGTRAVEPAIVPGTLVVSGDPVGLRQVVDNLVRNAVRHASARVEVQVRADRDEVVLDVDDDGPGVASADRSVVFEPFASRPDP